MIILDNNNATHLQSSANEQNYVSRDQLMQGKKVAQYKEAQQNAQPYSNSAKDTTHSTYPQVSNNFEKAPLNNQ